MYDNGWTALRDAQERAVAPLLAGDRDVVIAAATATGKTEAAFLPICSAIAPDSASGESQAPWAPTGIDVLCVSPLKALINDQYDRLERLCARVDVPVHRWHGDVASSTKHKALREPSGVLLITPESLEALFVTRGGEVGRLFAALRYVVVDELHSFLDEPRGAQLQSLLHRIELATRRKPPRVGLSATLSDMAVAARFLRPSDPEAPVVIESRSEQEIRLQVRGYREPGAPEANASEDDEGAEAAISAHLFEALRGTNNLVFANRRASVEIYADRLARLAEANRFPNEFWPHHGSLARSTREMVEAQLKDKTRPVTAVCTSTLELGIDIGSIASVAQVGCPPSVAAMRQRLGRSGRRGEPAVMRIYVTEPHLDSKSPLVDELACDVVQSIAMVELLLERWLEPAADLGLNLSTLIQQTLSVIAQRGGASAADAHRALCGPGPFERVTTEMYGQLLRSMAKADLIVQAGDGTLLHGEVGERCVNHYSFYAAFASTEEWRLVTSGQTLGTMPIENAIEIGGLLLFGGRRWRIVDIDEDGRVIELAPATGGRPPVFISGGAAVSDGVRERMKAVYMSTSVPLYLDRGAQELLSDARAAWMRMGLGGEPVQLAAQGTYLLPWVGDRTLSTMVLLLRMWGADAGVEGPASLVQNPSPAELADVVEHALTEGVPDELEVASSVENRRQDKWDWVLDGVLSTEAYAAQALDVAGAWEALTRLAGPLRRAAASSQDGGADPAVAPAAASPVRGADLEFCVIDVETTGFSPRVGNRIVEVAAVVMDAAGTVQEEWSTLVNPERDIGATSVHGISSEELRGAPVFSEIAGDLLSRLDRRVTVAHNHRFDWGFLTAEFERSGVHLPALPGLCTLRLGARLLPELPSRRLDACCAELGIPTSQNHQAMGDARATAQLLGAYLGLVSANGNISLANLGCEPRIWPGRMPEIQPTGKQTLRGTHDRSDEQAGYLGSLVARMQGQPSGPDSRAYLAVLDRALEDRHLSAEEAEALVETAQASGLDGAQVAAVHERYFIELIDLAFADGEQSAHERRDLDLVGRLLAIAPSDVERAVAAAKGRRRLTVERSESLEGLSVCFTGTLCCTLDGAPITRSVAESLASQGGLIISPRVSRALDILVTADPDSQSGKAQRARTNGTRIVAEPVFWERLGVSVG